MCWLLLCFIAASCRSKGDGCDDCGQLIPPFGVVASAVGGELAFFDLSDLHIIRAEQMNGWATACELLPPGNRFVTTDNESGAIAIYSIPELERLEHISIAGTLMDLRAARSGLSAHLITNNSRYYRISFSDLDVDTVFVGDNPRRLRMRPPSEFDTWITCRADCTVRVIGEQGFSEEMQINFPAICTDVDFSPNGEFAYCAVPSRSRVYKLDAENGDFVDSISVSGVSIDLAVSHDGRYLFAADSATGSSTVYDLISDVARNLSCGTSAIRPRYSVTGHAFLVICPEESCVLRVDPYSIPIVVTDTLRVSPIPQCISILE